MRRGVIALSVISENIKKRRRELKLSQEKLAELVYSSKSKINRIEKGTKDITYSEIEIFAEALHTSPAKLCGFKRVDDDYRNEQSFDLPTLAELLKKRGFEVSVFATKEEAVSHVVSIAKRNTGSVGLGSKIGFDEMGLTRALEDSKIQFSHASEIHSNRDEEKKAINSSIFILSATGISFETAEIVNISANSRSIAGSLSCADEVIFIIGKNKVTSNLDNALKRTKSGYISQIASAYGYNTPCATNNESCPECDEPDRLCRTTCIYHRPPRGMINRVILVDEPIGY